MYCTNRERQFVPLSISQFAIRAKISIVLLKIKTWMEYKMACWKITRKVRGEQCRSTWQLRESQVKIQKKKQKDQSMVSLDGLVYNPNGGTF